MCYVAQMQLPFSVLCIKAATGDTVKEMEAAVVTGSSGETMTGAAM